MFSYPTNGEKLSFTIFSATCENIAEFVENADVMEKILWCVKNGG
jgi:hypothetical protein